MNLLILAAGTGSRLSDSANHLPKILIADNGKTNLDRILNNFKRFTILNSIIVVGYKKFLFNNLVSKFNLIYNDLFTTTNMLFSLKMAFNKIDLNHDLFITYGDIVYTDKVIGKMYENPTSIVIASDRNWRTNWSNRFDNPLEDLEQFKCDAERKLVIKIGGKAKNLNDIDGQYMGILLFRKQVLKSILLLLNSLELDRSELSLEMASMTDFINFLISKGFEVGFEENEDPWIEIDNPKDLTIYEKIVTEIDILTFGTT
jgi:choline kinase